MAEVQYEGSGGFSEPGHQVSGTNETWVWDALSAGDVAEGPEDLDSAKAVVMKLPDNVAFVSVLGPRYWRPGDGGGCRFVFNPPLQTYAVGGGGRLSYTSIETGNPHFVNVTYPDYTVSFINATRPNDQSSSGHATVENVHLLDQQLDPNVSYHIAILNGPRNSSADAGPPRLGDRDADAQSSEAPGACNFTKVLAWVRYVEPSVQ